MSTRSKNRYALSTVQLLSLNVLNGRFRRRVHYGLKRYFAEKALLAPFACAMQIAVVLRDVSPAILAVSDEQVNDVCRRCS